MYLVGWECLIKIVFIENKEEEKSTETYIELLHTQELLNHSQKLWSQKRCEKQHYLKYNRWTGQIKSGVIHHFKPGLISSIKHG